MNTRTAELAEKRKPMESKKAASTVSPAVTNVKAQDFIGNIKDEIGKITWTSQEELKSYTKIVVWATLSLGLGIYLIDVVIQGCLMSLSAVVHLISR